MVYSNIDSRTSSQQAFIYRKVSSKTPRNRETGLSKKQTIRDTKTKKNKQFQSRLP